MNKNPSSNQLLFFLGTLSFCCALSSTSANAGEATNQVKAGINLVLNILRDPNLKNHDQKSSRRNKLRTAIANQFDFNEMSQRSLAQQWRKRSSKERAEFVKLFSVLMEKSYLRKIESYTDEVVEYTKEEIDENYAQVETLIITKRKQEIPIIYRLHKVNKKWWVYDVVVKGISLINTYRQQFRSIIRKSSYDGLVKILRRKRNGG